MFAQGEHGEESAPDDVGVVDERGATGAEVDDGVVEAERAGAAEDAAFDELRVREEVARLEFAAVEREHDAESDEKTGGHDDPDAHVAETREGADEQDVGDETRGGAEHQQEAGAVVRCGGGGHGDGFRGNETGPMTAHKKTAPESGAVAKEGRFLGVGFKKRSPTVQPRIRWREWRARERVRLHGLYADGAWVRGDG